MKRRVKRLEFSLRLLATLVCCNFVVLFFVLFKRSSPTVSVQLPSSGMYARTSPGTTQNREKLPVHR